MNILTFLTQNKQWCIMFSFLSKHNQGGRQVYGTFPFQKHSSGACVKNHILIAHFHSIILFERMKNICTLRVLPPEMWRGVVRQKITDGSEGHNSSTFRFRNKPNQNKLLQISVWKEAPPILRSPRSVCLAFSSILKMEAVRSSETSVNFYWITRRYIPRNKLSEIQVKIKLPL
jgi:hypothetical protein